MSRTENAKVSATVFYSWQTDLPHGTNRSLIETALERAVKVIRADGSLAVEPRIDQGTQGVPGAPDIAHTIFEKIEKAGAFVADLSIINPGAGGRVTPNPNVLIELGYALHALKKESVVLVMNTVNGPVESLPFDLRGRRVLTYHLAEGGDKPDERSKLQKGLEAALKAIFSEVKPAAVSTEPTAFQKALTAIETGSPAQAGLCAKFLSELASRVKEVTPICTRDTADTWNDRFAAAIEQTLPIVEDFAQLADAAAMHKSENAALGLFRGFAPLFALFDPIPNAGGGFYECDADLPKFIGYELVVILISSFIAQRHWEVVGELCAEQIAVPDPRSRLSSTKMASYLHAAEPLEWSRQEKGYQLAELLKKRHEQGRLAEYCPWDRFIEGDAFLFLRAGTEKDKAEVYDFWRPWSAPLLNGAPSFLREARSMKKAQPMIKAIGVGTIPELKSMIVQAAQNLTQYFGRRTPFYRPFEGLNLDELGSKA